MLEGVFPDSQMTVNEPTQIYDQNWAPALRLLVPLFFGRCKDRLHLWLFVIVHYVFCLFGHIGDLLFGFSVLGLADGKVLEWSSAAKVVGSILRPLHTSCGSVFAVSM